MTKVAKALIQDSTGKVLLLTRGETHPIFAGEIDLPGGIIEHDETYEDGIIREIQEETGIAIHPDQIVLSLTYGQDNRERRLYRAYLDTEQPVVTISWEHSTFAWEPIETLLQSHGLFSRDEYMKRVVSHLKSEQ